MLEQELYDAGEITSSSCLYDAIEIIERYDIDVRTVRHSDSIYAKDSLYLIDNDVEIRDDCIYQIKYLKNSRIIVEIQEVK